MQDRVKGLECTLGVIYKEQKVINLLSLVLFS